MNDDPAPAPTPPTRLRSRLIQLDILRAVAILMVLGRHPVGYAFESRTLRIGYSLWQRTGWAGVDLFFVLSGFLIGGLLFEELYERGRVDVGRFLVRRGFKIWPSYYVYLAYVAAAGLIGPVGQRFPIREIVPSLLNVQNYFTGMPRPHLWSLGVEEHFYLALPLMLALLVWRAPVPAGLRGIPGLVLAVCLGCLAARVVNVQARPYQHETHLFPTHLRVDSLAFGVLLAYLRRFRPEVWVRATRHRGPLLIFGLALVAPVFAGMLEQSRFVQTLGLTLLYLGFGAILAAFVSAPPVGLAGRLLGTRAARALAFIGLYSYPIYLWHQDFGLLPARWFYHSGALDGLPPEVRFTLATLVYGALAVGVGVVMGRLIERPALALRDRVFPDRLVDSTPAVPHVHPMSGPGQ